MPGLVGHVGEGAVAVVVVETVGVGGVVERAGIVIGGVEVAIFGIELHVAADEQIDAAVAIVVEPGGTDRPAVDLDAGFRGDIGEGAVAVVVIENRLAVAGNEEIDEAVVVEVGGDRGHAVDVRCDAGLVGDVGERAVAVVAIEMIVGRSRRRLASADKDACLFQRLAADHVEVGQAVVVVVEPDAAGAGAFEQRAELLRAEAVRELNAGLCGGVFEHRMVLGWRLRCAAPAHEQRGSQVQKT